MMSPSPALANRSFLYGDRSNVSAPAKTPDDTCLLGNPGRIVYATLDSLALARPPSRPTQLSLNETTTAAPAEPAKIKPETPAKRRSNSSPSSSNSPASSPTKSLESVEIALTQPTLPEPKPRSRPFEAPASNRSSGYEFTFLPKSDRARQAKKKKKPQQAGKDAEKKEKLTFAKNVLHYVPLTSRRYYRKSRKLASKSLSLKSLTNNGASGNAAIGLKSRSLSRDELKYVSISLPSNFVHLASATRDSLMPDAPLHEAKLKLISHETKYADLRDNFEYAEIAARLTDTMKTSFLWSNLPRLNEDADRPTPCEEDDYDDVGPPVEQTDHMGKPNDPEEKTEEPDQDTYDDVLPPVDSNSSSFPDDGENKENAEESLYDDVGLMLPNYEVPKELSSSERPTDAPQLDQADEDVYDDVGPPVTLNSQDSHERVNSIYAGFSVAGSISNYYDKESEWEDLDDAGIYGMVASSPKVPETSHSSPTKKKLAGQRWSRKVRRQRSRASRKSSGRSTSRTRLRSESLSHSSDDSNYETLETYESDNFSSDSEHESSNPASISVDSGNGGPALKAPNRPVPPPPREASLGHTLGRRMKMLRRTWSITKGSLGRMRRRASGDCEPPQPPEHINHHHHNNNNSADARKYFSFKKHFRKSPATCLSTFYLDKGSDADQAKEEEEEPIYANSSWYRDAGLYANRPDTQPPPTPDQTPIDHYSVLTEEPLYQFYTAAATSVALQSDSDGYEEVEELTPSTATTDLARPGHRTLWCQTPQVINSGLLQRLTAEERKIQEAKFEILTSEASYLNSLRVLENEFASSTELGLELLSSAEQERLFGEVPGVLAASERFLAELESIWHEDPLLGKLTELLLRHSERSAPVYVNYCSNQVSIDTTLKDLRAKKGVKFIDAVTRIESRPACQSLTLHSFLMLPMQRITRLPLLADAVLSKLSVDHPERRSWEEVLASLSNVVAKCNEGARQAERLNEMNALARKLEYSTKVPPVDLRERELIRSGTVVHLSTKHDSEYKLTFGKKFHKTPLMLLLITDHLLVTKLKSNSNDDTYSVIDTCKRCMVTLESVTEDSPFAGRHAMVLTLLENYANRQVEYVLTCENDTEKERWLDAISPPKPSCVGETLYESWDCPQVMAVFSHTPRQPDELALQPGDVINVLRKMNDGWLFGEKLLDGEQGWFPGNFTKEVASEHVRARNLKQRHRFLALSGSALQRKAKQSLSLL